VAAFAKRLTAVSLSLPAAAILGVLSLLKMLIIVSFDWKGDLI
jgi:hypothetical protein